jgi:hypothetical protein
VTADSNYPAWPPDQPRRPVALTAFAETEAELRELCATAEFDAASFDRKLARCDLSHCRGMCCYDGVYVNQDTADVLRKLAIERAADFRDMGLNLPGEILMEDRWCPSSLVTNQKTAIREYPFSSVMEEYPTHFRQTACVFMLGDGRCGLQALSEQDGQHPWYYKPLLCWLHPIAVTPDKITVHDEWSDPYVFPWYDGYVIRTFCGRTYMEGAAAADTLAEELAFLERILNRNLRDNAATGGREARFGE